MHTELLRLAGLLSVESGGLPRWVSHNRAVSTAYYALFHAVAEFCARELVGAWTPWPAFRHVYRSLDHGQSRKVFEELAKRSDSPLAIRNLAVVFVSLQKVRHSADYDPGFRVSGPELDDILARAERGIDLLAGLPSDQRSLLAAQLIGRTRS